MARAHSIFILRTEAHRSIIGAWTVKHELATYIKQSIMPRKSFEEYYEIIRSRDGQINSGTTIPWEEIP